MDRRNIYIIIGAVIVLVVIGYASGWFGGSAPPPARSSIPAGIEDKAEALRLCVEE